MLFLRLLSRYVSVFLSICSTIISLRFNSLLESASSHVSTPWFHSPQNCNLNQHRCEGGELYRPELCSVDIRNGSAILYACGAHYKRGEPGSEATWQPSNTLNQFIGKTREMFYKQEERVYYAGTFKASLTISDLNNAEFCALAKPVCLSIKFLFSLFIVLITFVATKALGSLNCPRKVYLKREVHHS